jgi:phosphoribosylformylglycinamidine synthase subunit PurSL
MLIVGETKNELGGSQYYKLRNELGANVPKVNLKAAPKVMQAMAEAIRQGLVASCHDCSEGGLAVALAEMAFAGGLGMEINLADTPTGRDVSRTDQTLFSESPSRFVIEAAPENLAKLARTFQNVRFGQIGKVTDEAKLVIKDANNKAVIDAGVAELKEA